jgi:hypothetical protein
MEDNREYLILPVSEIPKIVFSEILETSAETLRRSVDLLKTLIKWEGLQPSFISSLDNTEGPYTYEEIIVILSGPEWSNPGPM